MLEGATDTKTKQETNLAYEKNVRPLNNCWLLINNAQWQILHEQDKTCPLLINIIENAHL